MKIHKSLHLHILMWLQSWHISLLSQSILFRVYFLLFIWRHFSKEYKWQTFLMLNLMVMSIIQILKIFNWKVLSFFQTQLLGLLLHALLDGGWGRPWHQPDHLLTTVDTSPGPLKKVWKQKRSSILSLLPGTYSEFKRIIIWRQWLKIETESDDQNQMTK